MRDEQRRMAVLGLDGLPLSLALSLAGQGVAPNLGRILAQARTIRAELPEISPVNWTSFYTAKGPEEHGVIGFTRIDGNYAVRFVDSESVLVPSIFERLAAKGLCCKVVNLPNTYPARRFSRMRGMLVSGFVAPELSRAVHPPFLAGPLNAAGYRLEADLDRAAKDPDFLLSELRSTLKSREKALDLLWPDLAWDLFVLVLTETDRLFHFLFSALAREEHPLREPCLAFMAEWDRLIGRFLEMYDHLPEPKRLMILADHGFTETRAEVDLNQWLKREGFLRLRKEEPGRDGEFDLSRMAPESEAFALSPGRIFVHARDRFARGSVLRSRVEDVIQRIRAGLAGLTFEQSPVIERTFSADEIYPGRTFDHAPDILCLANPGFDLRGTFNRKEIFGLFGRSGTHTADGGLFYDSAGSEPDRLRQAGMEVLSYFDAAEAGTKKHNKAIILSK